MHWDRSCRLHSRSSRPSILISLPTHHAVDLRCMTQQGLLGASTLQQQNLHHCWTRRLLRILSKRTTAVCKPPLSISMLR